jgi:hypothetical protein
VIRNHLPVSTLFFGFIRIFRICPQKNTQTLKIACNREPLDFEPVNGESVIPNQKTAFWGLENLKRERQKQESE